MKTLLAEGWLENGGRSVVAVVVVFVTTVVVAVAAVDSADDIRSSEADTNVDSSAISGLVTGSLEEISNVVVGIEKVLKL